MTHKPTTSPPAPPPAPPAGHQHHSSHHQQGQPQTASSNNYATWERTSTNTGPVTNTVPPPLASAPIASQHQLQRGSMVHSSLSNLAPSAEHWQTRMSLGPGSGSIMGTPPQVPANKPTGMLLQRQLSAGQASLQSMSGKFFLSLLCHFALAIHYCYTLRYILSQSTFVSAPAGCGCFTSLSPYGPRPPSQFCRPQPASQGLKSPTPYKSKVFLQFQQLNGVVNLGFRLELRSVQCDNATNRSSSR